MYEYRLFMAIGDRLREERERLRLSQADFAEQAGIHRNTQVRYETNKTEPETSYLETIRALGVDVDYVLFGLPNPNAPVTCPFLERLGVNRPITLHECRWNASGQRGATSAHAVAHQQACKECPKNPITHGVSVDVQTADVDGRLLERLLEEIESRLEKSGRKLAPAKKARIVVMLYRASRAVGNIDLKMIEDAIALAGD
jgi:transcriptional regulator with XRE-family HTH domain